MSANITTNETETSRTFLSIEKDAISPYYLVDAKFWNVRLRGVELTTTWGYCGGRERSNITGFSSAEEAQKELEKRIAEKINNGYRETTPVPSDKTQQAFEDALASDPDDDGAHAAYADYLLEQDDPKGEYLQIQLALEDESLEEKQRKKVNRRAKRLYRENEFRWFADAVLLLRYATCKHQLRRGWVHQLDLHYITQLQVDVITQSPQLRLLRDLTIRRPESYPFDGIHDLIGCPQLANVQRLRLGGGGGQFRLADAEVLLEMIAGMPRLEELTFEQLLLNLTPFHSAKFPESLRALTFRGDYQFNGMELAYNTSLASLKSLRLCPEYGYRGSEMPAPLESMDLQGITRSPYLKGLTELGFWRSDVGDAGIDELISSGMLGRLESLDLSHGCVTDRGAIKLAEAIHPEKLTNLILADNAIGSSGAEALTNRLPSVMLGQQHEVGDFDYLVRNPALNWYYR